MIETQTIETNGEGVPLRPEIKIHMSSTVTKLAPALVKAQRSMGSAHKGAANPFYKSRYADLAEIIETCKDALNDNGIAFLQPIATGEKGVVVTTWLLHESGEYIASEIEFPVSKLDSQAYGSAVSYARRYSLMSLLSIPCSSDEDDDGNAASGKKENPYSKAMMQDFPPGVDRLGTLLHIESPVGPGKPSTAKIETPNGIETFSIYTVEESWVGLVGCPVMFQYAKEGRNWVLSQMREQAKPTNATPTPKPQATPAKAIAKKISQGMRRACLQEVDSSPGAPAKLLLALENGDLEASTLLKPERLGVPQWQDAIGRELYFKTAPKDPQKIIDLLTLEAYEQLQGASA
jgi:hypothetical protein